MTTPKHTLPQNYRERVYAGWIGKCAGVRLGAPVEGWTQQDIHHHLVSVADYLPLPPGKIFKPDDDTATPMVLPATHAVVARPNQPLASVPLPDLWRHRQDVLGPDALGGLGQDAGPA